MMSEEVMAKFKNEGEEGKPQIAQISQPIEAKSFRRLACGVISH